MDWVIPETKINFFSAEYKETKAKYMAKYTSFELGIEMCYRSLLRKYELNMADSLLNFESLFEREDEAWNLEDTTTNF